MMTEIFYRADDLLRLLPGFEVRKITTIDRHEDEPTTQALRCYITSRDNIERVKMSYGFWRTEHVILEDGQDIVLLSNNVNSKDTSILRIESNNIISPSIKMHDNYIEVTESIALWLKNQGLTDEQLGSITEQFTLKPSMIYEKVPTPRPCDGGWILSSEPLELNVTEIDEVLSKIDDPLLHKKIDLLLHAGIFKEKY